MALATYRVEVTGWNSYGESVVDEADVVAESEDDAVNNLVDRMRRMWDFTEVGDCRVYRIVA